MEQEWYASSNEERFTQGPFESRDVAIAEAKNLWPGRDHVFVGVKGEYEPFNRDFVEELCELEACDVNDECGSEASDNWPPWLDSKSEDYKEANRKIRAILMELCGDCDVFPITDSERVEQDTTA